MKKIAAVVTVLGILSLLAWALPVSAKKQSNDKGPLGKITFIHHKKRHAKPPKGNQGKRKKGPKCYDFLARGVRWKGTEAYLVNPTGSGLPETFVKEAIDEGVSEWEGYGGDIFGPGSLDSSATYNNGDLDSVNTASFGPYPDPNVIAVTTIWGYFSGPRRARELVEWDILFNNASSWDWGDAKINPSLMDLQNIATHELGHSAGMDDLYETSCNLETMYGYSDVGDTMKRDLNTGDITGIQELYK